MDEWLAAHWESPSDAVREIVDAACAPTQFSRSNSISLSVRTVIRVILPVAEMGTAFSDALCGISTEVFRQLAERCLFRNEIARWLPIPRAEEDLPRVVICPDAKPHPEPLLNHSVSPVAAQGTDASVKLPVEASHCARIIRRLTLMLYGTAPSRTSKP